MFCRLQAHCHVQPLVSERYIVEHTGAGAVPTATTSQASALAVIEADDASIFTDGQDNDPASGTDDVNDDLLYLEWYFSLNTPGDVTLDMDIPEHE